MSEPVIAMQTTKPNDLYEASNVYSVGGGQYLLLVECIGVKSSPGGIRYFKSWTSSNLAGPWTALAATEANPFMGAANVQFASGKSWTESFSHGEIIRTVVDQSLTIKPCSMRFLYQGISPSANANYNSLPWTLGLLTQVGNSC
ncbi:alpha-L-arabinofuranosidase precursor [Pyrenophora tritici-repentis]|nr:Glycoside hydrolase [Pyrenophora tritici-repentis]KAF7446133.1 Glycoside hydrolase [Pyrenophora tritici-repentis]KAG9381838.1 Glycoside hydrolase [Pyrenophora tritici-repentis]KAI1549628.1 alpha-L-arabinofuranosidase precursor [Pyrenophora tritici-repentis]KAI1551440.1 alpha-L-arabinofuranosidase precursor [Pyrenophora tritici-repentis]